MTREEILAIRATGLALVAQCDAALARPVELVMTPANAGSIFAEPCSHPTVISTAVSGLPNRGKCTACGATVEPVEA